MTDEKPPISLAAARAERERDFRRERLDLTKELEEIGVTSAELVQHVMLLEWAIYKSALMLEYHGIDYRDARAVVELAKLLVHRK